MFFTLLFYQSQKKTELKVLRIISPTQIVVDLNKNDIEDNNETITLQNIQSFSTKPSKEQNELAKKIKISSIDALGLGFLAENFAKETLSDKKIKLSKDLSQIYVDNKNYENLILNKGLALKKDNPPSKIFLKNLDAIRKLHLVIFNNKSHKFHKLDCKYGLMAHNSQIIPASQVPEDAKPCKFCLVKRHEYKKYKKYFHKNFKPFKYYDDTIPFVKSPATIFESGNIKIFLTDMTKVLRPSNNCSTPVCKALVQEINSAQNTIDFAIYGYSKIPALQQALANAQNRGVKIRFVYDSDKKNSNYYPDTNYLSTLITNNQHDTTSAIMHDKFFIFDNKTILTGSANISTTDMSGFNSNATIIIKSDDVANTYTQEFEQMYNGKFHKRKHKIKNEDCEDLKVYFSPKDKTITSEIIPLIDNAKTYIYMPAFVLTHKEFTDNLIAATHRGVAVKIILDATSTHSSASKMKLLRSNNIQVKTENIAGKLHSKSIIIDDLYTVIGSMNFSKSGETENDENLLIIKNKEIAVFYKTFFQYLWRRIPDKWLKYNARAEAPESIGSCSDGIDNDFDGKIDKADDSCKPITYNYKKKPIKKVSNSKKLIQAKH